MGDILGPPKSDIMQRFAEKNNIQIVDIPLEEPCSKEALKVLNEKEKHLKEDIMKLIIKSKADDKSVVRVLAFLINSFKRL